MQIMTGSSKNRLYLGLRPMVCCCCELVGGEKVWFTISPPKDNHAMTACQKGAQANLHRADLAKKVYLEGNYT